MQVDEESKLFYFDVYPNEDGIVNVTVLAYTGTDDALNYNYESNTVSIELGTYSIFSPPVLQRNHT